MVDELVGRVMKLDNQTDSCMGADWALWGSRTGFTGMCTEVISSANPATFLCRVTCGTYVIGCMVLIQRSPERKSSFCRDLVILLGSLCFNNYTVLSVCVFFLSLISAYCLKSYGLAYNLSKIPTSKKGYTFGARTAVRFEPISKVRNAWMCLDFRVICAAAKYLHWGTKLEVT